MPYLIKLRKKNSYQWIIYRISSKIQVYNSEERAKEDIEKIENELNRKAKIMFIKHHPKSRASNLWRKKWEDVT